MPPPDTPPVFHEWSMSDGYTLRGRIWPASSSKADRAILYLHGIQSHGGWFEWSAARLAESGRAVILPDRRGSGMNAEARGDVPSWSRWLSDLDDIASWTSHEFQVSRFDVVGISWGGKPALAWGMRRPELVERVLLIAPGIFPAVDVGIRARFQIVRSLLTDPGRKFPIPLSEPALFTDNPTARKFISEDPLKLTEATARFFWHSRELDRILARKKPSECRATLTLALAEHDKIIRNSLTHKWINKISAGAAVVHELAGAAHTLEFEEAIAPYKSLLCDWSMAGR